MVLAAPLAAHRAIVADIAAALAAPAGAVAAQIALAPFAAGPVVFVGDTAAVGAGSAAPAVERDVGALRVVGGERLGDDREEVQEPARGERRADRSERFPLAEPLVVNVGMGDARIGPRGVGVERHDDVSGIPPEKYAAPADVLACSERITNRKNAMAAFS
jgi:hypothetical protein